jgi:hypothetical protein
MMDLRTQYFPTCLNNFSWNLINTWIFIPFQLPSPASEALGFGTNHPLGERRMTFVVVSVH